MNDALIKKEMKTLSRFVQVYCNAHHQTKKGALCEDCNRLLQYARKRLEKCPYDPKPKCKDCETHCYKPEYRAQIKRIMRYSGMHFIRRGRLDWAIRYFM